MSQAAQNAAELESKLESVARFNRNLQSNEVLTLHYLGLPYLVMSRSPLLRLKVPLSTFNYQDGASVGCALQLIFSCPANYPLQLPRVELAEKRNVCIELEQRLREQIALTLEQHLGLYMIVPVVTRVQMVLNSEMGRLPLASH